MTHLAWLTPNLVGLPNAGSQCTGDRRDTAELPRLRSDVAARLPRTAAADWLLAFFVLLAKGARAATRRLERLLEVAERGRGR